MKKSIVSILVALGIVGLFACYIVDNEPKKVVFKRTESAVGDGDKRIKYEEEAFAKYLINSYDDESTELQLHQTYEGYKISMYLEVEDEEDLQGLESITLIYGHIPEDIQLETVFITANGTSYEIRRGLTRLSQDIGILHAALDELLDSIPLDPDQDIGIIYPALDECLDSIPADVPVIDSIH